MALVTHRPGSMPPVKPIDVLRKELEDLDLEMPSIQLLTGQDADLEEIRQRQMMQLPILRAMLSDMDEDIGGPSDAGAFVCKTVAGHMVTVPFTPPLGGAPCAVRKVGCFPPPVATGPRVRNSAPYSPLLVHLGCFV